MIIAETGLHLKEVANCGTHPSPIISCSVLLFPDGSVDVQYRITEISIPVYPPSATEVAPTRPFTNADNQSYLPNGDRLGRHIFGGSQPKVLDRPHNR